MEGWYIAGMTAALYVTLIQFLPWLGRIIFEYAHPPAGRMKNKPLNVELLVHNSEDRLEGAIRYVAWFSFVEGIPLSVCVYESDSDDMTSVLLRKAEEDWPGLIREVRAEKNRYETVSSEDACWTLDLRAG
ncbi:hypothetical protein [Aneurinibacillus tyrosinisolvens]|uniref:hypothetical protein n=1 Tax=Aneurinibacillus tyrosinisolvens TaxID=1443435 RepID=UPI00063F1567|nr:hypothetical protein [Aneurinibacillus tyrosinisolvens]